MIEQKIDEDGDLILTSNSTVKDKEKILQDIRVQLKYILGEWFADNSLGIPYFDQILGDKEKNVNIFISMFINKINNIDGVISCIFNDYTFDKGSLTLNFTVQTIFETTNLSFNV